MDELFIIRSEQGDEYKLRISTNSSGLVSDKVHQQLLTVGLDIMDIDLYRSKGFNVTDHKVLAKIEECIADVFLSHPNVVICFFCDFIGLLPNTTKTMSVQKYRSLLFSKMFERYVKTHHIDGVRNHIVTIKGVAEDYYVHIISRVEHSQYAWIIGEGIQKDFGK